MHAALFLQAVDSLDQLTRNIGVERHTAGSRLPRDGNDLPQVQPADYVRLASARAARPEMTASIGGNDNARLAYMLLAAMGA